MRVSGDEGTDDDEREAAADSTGEEKHTASNTVEEEDSRKSEDLKGLPSKGSVPSTGSKSRPLGVSPETDGSRASLLPFHTQYAVRCSEGSRCW
jgi:hypothetical protein